MSTCLEAFHNYMVVQKVREYEEAANKALETNDLEMAQQELAKAKSTMPESLSVYITKRFDHVQNLNNLCKKYQIKAIDVERQKRELQERLKSDVANLTGFSESPLSKYTHQALSNIQKIFNVAHMNNENCRVELNKLDIYCVLDDIDLSDIKNRGELPEKRLAESLEDLFKLKMHCNIFPKIVEKVKKLVAVEPLLDEIDRVVAEKDIKAANSLLGRPLNGSRVFLADPFCSRAAVYKQKRICLEQLLDWMKKIPAGESNAKETAATLKAIAERFAAKFQATQPSSKAKQKVIELLTNLMTKDLTEEEIDQLDVEVKKTGIKFTIPCRDTALTAIKEDCKTWSWHETREPYFAYRLINYCENEYLRRLLSKLCSDLQRG